MKKIILLVMVVGSLFAGEKIHGVKYQTVCIHGQEFLTTIVLDHGFSYVAAKEATTIALYESRINTSYPLVPKHCNYFGTRKVKD